MEIIAAQVHKICHLETEEQIVTFVEYFYSKKEVI